MARSAVQKQWEYLQVIERQRHVEDAVRRAREYLRRIVEVPYNLHLDTLGRDGRWYPRDEAPF